jgi:DNA-binding NarL/FixJ family response regulator
MDLDTFTPEEGIAAVRTMRESCPDIPIVALTDYGQVRLKRAALGAGAVACLPKGISVEQLATVISCVCNGEPLPS